MAKRDFIRVNTSKGAWMGSPRSNPFDPEMLITKADGDDRFVSGVIIGVVVGMVVALGLTFLA
jgi:hypothetical protein